MSVDWHARIISDNCDQLRNLVSKFNGKNFSLVQIEQEIFIESVFFKELHSPLEVFNKAENILKTFEGLILVNSSLPKISIRVNGVVNLSTKESYSFVNNYADLNCSLVVANEIITAKNPNNNPSRWIDLFLVDENVKEAFEYARLNMNEPFIMYSIYEIIRKDVKRDFTKINSKYSNAILSSFTGTLNDPREIGEIARHAVPLGKDRMANPMTLNQCSDFIRDLFHEWIHYKLVQHNL